jgi:hypothetical protein
MLLDDSDVLELVTTAGGGTNLVFVVGAQTDTGTAVTGYVNDGASNGTTPVTMMASPPAGQFRRLLYASVRNTGSAAYTATIRVNTRAVRNVGLGPGEYLEFSGRGWRVFDVEGREKIITPPNTLVVGDAPTFFKNGTAAEAAGSWYGMMKDGGFPAAWVPGTPGLNGAAVSAPFDGIITLANTATARRLTYAAVTSSVAAQFLLLDMLWYNTGLNVATLTEQAITSPTLPARDINGGTVGEGCMIGIYFTTASTQASPVATTTIRYTNSAGTPNRTATLVAVAGSQIPATPVIGTIVWFQLQAGDTGVRSIEGITLVTAQTGGAISVFIARPVLAMPCPIANIPNTPYVNPAGIQLFASSALFLAYCAAGTTALAVSGTLATSPV